MKLLVTMLLFFSCACFSNSKEFPKIIKLPNGTSYGLLDFFKQDDGTLKKTGVESPLTIDVVMETKGSVELLWLEQTCLNPEYFNAFKQKVTFYLNYAAGGQLFQENPNAKRLKVNVNIILLCEVTNDRFNGIDELKDQFEKNDVGYYVIKSWKKVNADESFKPVSEGKAIQITEAIAEKEYRKFFGYSKVVGIGSEIKYLELDLTCDGVNDYVMSRNNPLYKYGPRFEIMFITGHSGKIGHATSLMGYGVDIDWKKQKSMMTLIDEAGVPNIDVISEFVVDGKSSIELSCNKGLYVHQKSELGYILYFDRAYNSFKNEVVPVRIDAKEINVNSKEFHGKWHHYTL